MPVAFQIYLRCADRFLPAKHLNLLCKIAFQSPISCTVALEIIKAKRENASFPDILAHPWMRARYSSKAFHLVPVKSWKTLLTCLSIGGNWISSTSLKIVVKMSVQARASSSQVTSLNPAIDFDYFRKQWLWSYVHLTNVLFWGWAPTKQPSSYFGHSAFSICFPGVFWQFLNL